jgi:hypothetical protein
MTEHRLGRPGWTCLADGDEWPCGQARKALLGHYGQDFEAAARHLLYLMGWAPENAADALGVPAATLYRRIVGWTLPKEHTCRACGVRGHDVLPGLPPRLFPCKGRVVPPMRGPRSCDGAAATQPAPRDTPTADDEPDSWE